MANDRDGCAGDGEPPSRPFAASFLLAADVLPYAGADLSLRAGDPGDAGVPLWPGLARVALCGQVHLGRHRLLYDLGYEPVGALEAAHQDATRWGRLLAAEVGYPLLAWLTLYAGVRKVAFSYGHDAPEQSLELPVRPYLSSSVAPDRRLGVTLDDNWGPSRVLIGLYESARTFAEFPQTGVLVTGRGVIEPLGPVGRSISTLADDPYWRSRLRMAFNISILFQWSPMPNLPYGPYGLALGGDIPLKFGPLGLVVEYLYAHGTSVEDPTLAPGVLQNRQGLWAQAALMLLRPYLELEARYEWFDLPADPLQRFHALTAGLTGYGYGSHLKIQAAYGHKFHLDDPGIHDDFLLLQVQIAR